MAKSLPWPQPHCNRFSYDAGVVPCLYKDGGWGYSIGTIDEIPNDYFGCDLRDVLWRRDRSGCRIESPRRGREFQSGRRSVCGYTGVALSSARFRPIDSATEKTGLFPHRSRTGWTGHFLRSKVPAQFARPENNRRDFTNLQGQHAGRGLPEVSGLCEKGIFRQWHPSSLLEYQVRPRVRCFLFPRAAKQQRILETAA